MLNLGKPLSPKQRLDKAVIDIMGHERYVALAGTLMIGDRVLDDTIPTACTDGKNERYSPAFIEKQSDAQLRYLVLHEVYHKLFKHLSTWRWMFEENQQLANVACDYAINVRISDDNKDGFAVMPEGGLIDEKYRGWDSAAIYHDLKKKYGGGQGGKCNHQPGQGGQGQGDDQPCPQCKGMPGGGFDEHDWQAAKEMTAEEQRELARELDEAVRQGALLAGKTGSGGLRDLTDLLEPQIDWREALREFVTSTCAGKDYSTWMRPSRRYIGAGYYMPSGISEQVDELLVAIDTSGSIGQRELTVMLSELASIANTVKPKAVRLLYWDTTVCRDEKYLEHEVADIAKSTKPAGGGGTMVECVPEHMTAEGIAPQAAIILTDGYLGGSWGSWPCPTLWVILDNEGCTAGVGKTLHVKARDL